MLDRRELFKGGAAAIIAAKLAPVVKLLAPIRTRKFPVWSGMTTYWMGEPNDTKAWFYPAFTEVELRVDEMGRPIVEHGLFVTADGEPYILDVVDGSYEHVPALDATVAAFPPRKIRPPDVVRFEEERRGTG